MARQRKAKTKIEDEAKPSRKKETAFSVVVQVRVPRHVYGKLKAHAENQSIEQEQKIPVSGVIKTAMVEFTRNHKL